MKLFDELKWRGLIQDISSPEIENLINEGNVTFYWGTDPTAESLHVGHYTNLVLARNFKKHGHHPILLVGGATAQIGDPRGKGERVLETKEKIAHNYEMIKEQVEKITGCETVNNYDWIKDINVLDFLRDYGKHFPVNYMLAKDKVKKQLENGLSFTEFSYMILQALDFKYLHENRGVNLQIAGSDQWGNITSGIELIRKTTGDEVFGFTMPLILDENGNKIGKSEGNAVWLNKDMCSSYKLYQYLINTDDKVVVNYLKAMTLLEPERIIELEECVKNAPEKREAQKALAYEVVKDVHGEEEAKRAIATTEALFSGDVSNLSGSEIEDVFKDAPNFVIENDENILDFLAKYGIVSSKREGRELITSGSILVNGIKETNLEKTILRDEAIDNKFVIVRRGKKKYYLGRYE